MLLLQILSSALENTKIRVNTSFDGNEEQLNFSFHFTFRSRIPTTSPAYSFFSSVSCVLKLTSICLLCLCLSELTVAPSERASRAGKPAYELGEKTRYSDRLHRHYHHYYHNVPY